MEHMKFISASQVKNVLTFELLIPQMEKALSKFSDKKVIQPVRSVIPVKESGGFFGLMPSLCSEDNVLATKLVSFYPNNKDFPTHNAVIAMFNASNGVPEVIVDGEVITAMRTAAVSAVATKFLCNKTPKVLALLGSGVQARSHFQALSTLYTFEEIRVWGRTKTNVETLASELNGTACQTAEDAVKGADVIVTVTSSTIPILKKEWVKPGAHINAVGACRPDWQEIDPELMRSVSLFVDSRDAAIAESGDVILSKADIEAEVGEVILGKNGGRRTATEVTLFKSLGLAIEDALSAKLVCDLLSSSNSS
ncbi:ketimine reductase mu-crystallin-like isoform X1 [Mytilus trossulus]|uniref:ketimine reductase mu-crystallin-like isoform X1 n=1 Tax=Mytilus trossulus TaxID=6551 RepID=UPI00300643FD